MTVVLEQMKHTTSPLAPEPTSAGGKDDSTEGPEGVTEQDVEGYLKEVAPPTPHWHRNSAPAVISASGFGSLLPHLP